MCCMKKIVILNSDKDGTAPTVLAGYFKFGSQTLILGNYGTTGGQTRERPDMRTTARGASGTINQQYKLNQKQKAIV